jgi:hypothetical protein
MKDCFKCCICHDVAGFISILGKTEPGDFDVKDDIKCPVICKRCERSFIHWSTTNKHATLGLLAWAAKRSRDAQKRRHLYGETK